MKIIKLDYFTLLSPDPIEINGVGRIISPKLRDISKINYAIYNMHIDALFTDIKTYYEIIEKTGDVYFSHRSLDEKNIILNVKKEYESLSEEEKTRLSFFNILIFDNFYKKRILDALNFFIIEDVVFSEEDKMFVIYERKETSSSSVGYIYQDNYEIIVDIILQRIGMGRQDMIGDNAKPKNKAAIKILEKIKNGKKKENKKNKKPDKKMELSNIISSLATHSKTLNMINIWDLTVYQLYDQFARQQIDDSYSISASHLSAWGDKDNKFDGTLWFSLIDKD